MPEYWINQFLKCKKKNQRRISGILHQSRRKFTIYCNRLETKYTLSDNLRQWESVGITKKIPAEKRKKNVRAVCIFITSSMISLNFIIEGKSCGGKFLSGLFQPTFIGKSVWKFSSEKKGILKVKLSLHSSTFLPCSILLSHSGQRSKKVQIKKVFFYDKIGKNLFFDKCGGTFGFFIQTDKKKNNNY